MELPELLNSLGRHVGLELSADEAGTCQLDIDGMVVVIQDVSEAYAVGFWGRIGLPPPEGLERLYEMMLDANHLFRATAGATLSRDPDSGEFYLCRLFDIRCLDAETFVASLEKFVNTLEAWQKIVADYRPPAEAEERAADESGGALGPLSPISGSGFVQV